MDKESTTARTPRLKGVSRIPLPGSITPLRPAPSMTVSASSIKPTQIFRRPNVPGAYVTKQQQQQQQQQQQRKMSYGSVGLATATTGMKAPLQNSPSDERIKNVYKKYLDGSSTIKPTAVATPLQKRLKTADRHEAQCDRPQQWTRSETFVCDNSSDNMFDTPRVFLAQSTPMSAAVNPLPYESTSLLRNSGAGRSKLHAAQSLDATLSNLQEQPPLAFESTRILDQTSYPTTPSSALGLTEALPSRSCIAFGMTLDMINTTGLDRPNNVTHTLENVATQLLGQTLHVASPSEHLQAQLDVNLNATMTLNGTQFIDKIARVDETLCLGREQPSELSSPATNATYSNPGSMDNLSLLAHVSMPSGLNAESTLCDMPSDADRDETLKALAPDKANMKLPLNSALNAKRLVDVTDANLLSNLPARHIQLLNLTKEFAEAPPRGKQANRNSISPQLLWFSPQSATTTTDHRQKQLGSNYQQTPVPVYQLSPTMLKGTQSELVLPIRTPDEEGALQNRKQLDTLTALESLFHEQKQQAYVGSAAVSLQDVNNPSQAKKTRFSFGLDLPDCTLDCSIELVDSSISSSHAQSHDRRSSLLLSAGNMSPSPSTQQSFDFDESLGILTPNQMKEFLDSTQTPQMLNTHNLDLPLHAASSVGQPSDKRINIQQMRMEQTPSPEELPLDTIKVKTDITDELDLQQQQFGYHQQQQQLHGRPQHKQQQPQQQELKAEQESQESLPQMQQSNSAAEPLSQHTDTEHSKAEQLTKSSVSKISTSFITSVTSVTSLDTGYQGDGEMSRPASRGACDQSPLSGPNTRKSGVARQPSFNQQPPMPPIRRQDPMTDSDFFTESDADDGLHRGDRRAQVIDGQLYGPTMQPTASVFISKDPQMGDSCMESSGIFTDVENRCYEDPVQMRRQNTQEMQDLSPDADGDGDGEGEGEGEGDDSTETVKSGQRLRRSHENDMTADAAAALGQGQLQQQLQLSCNSQTSSTIQSSLSNDRLSAATTLSNRTSYCSVDGGCGSGGSVVGMHADSKSFASLEEAFGGGDDGKVDANVNRHSGSALHSCVKRTKSATNNCGGVGSSSSSIAVDHTTSSERSHLPAVQREHSPRKHASLSSLAQFASPKSSSSSSVSLPSGANTANTKCLPTPLRASDTSASTSTSSSAASGTSGSKLSLNDQSVKSVSNVSKTRAKQTTTTSTTTTNYNNTATISNLPTTKSAKKQTTNGENTTIDHKPKVTIDNLKTTITTISTSTTPPLRKTHSPPFNKWNAVMNKIASNKSVIKTNYSDVKSKVSTTRAHMSPSPTNGSPTAMGKQAPSATAVRLRLRPTSSGPRSGSASLASAKISLKLTRGTISSNNKTSPTPTSMPASLSVTQQPQDKGASGGSGSGSAGAGSRATVNGRFSNATTPTSPTSPTSPPAKRLQSSVSLVKRGRSYSKDSQKSSQSDLSLLSRNASGGGSPKLLAKTPLRAAKKRDVRNLSISPTDLGPPPKTQQTAKGHSTRAKQNGSGVVASLLLKKTTSTDARTSVSKAAGQCSSPCGTKPLSLTSQITKTPSAVVNSSHSSSSRTQNNNTTNNNHNLSPKLSSVRKTSTRNLADNHATTTTEESQKGELHAHAAEATTPTSDLKAKTIGLTEESASSPASGCICKAAAGHCAYCQNNNQRKLTGNLEALPAYAAAAVAATAAETWPSERSNWNGEANKSSDNLASSAQAESVCPLNVCRLADDQLTCLQNFTRADGSLDLGKLEVYLKQVDRLHVEYERRITGMGCVVQHVSQVLEDCTSSREECLKNQQELKGTQLLLEESRCSCEKLQNQLDGKLSEYAEREAQHRCEIEQIQDQLSEVKMQQKQRMREYEAQLTAKDEEHKRGLDVYQSEMCRKMSYGAEKLQIAEEHVLKLQQQVQLHETNELELLNKLTNMESQCARRLKAANEREDELNNCIKSLTKELTALRREQDEANAPKPNADDAYWKNKKREVEHIVEYERSELQSRLDEQTALNEKIAKLETDDDMLRTELASRSDHNKDLQRRYEKVEHSLNRSYAKQQNLCSNIEEQELQLKQRCKQLQIIEAKLQERCASGHTSNGTADTAPSAEHSSPTGTSYGHARAGSMYAAQTESVSGRKVSASDDLNWKNEAESLRSVLELKQHDFSKINKKYADLKRRLEEQSTMNKKISKLESDNELLRMELESKSDSERELQRQIDQIQGQLSHSNTKRERLFCDIESLQYLLKHRSEQLQIVESKLKDYSSFETSLNSATSSFSNSQRNSMSHGSSAINNSSGGAKAVDSNFPPASPASPAVKGIIEKNESISWVLEMDDETPEVAASKLVKRASSLRSSFERSPNQTRPYKKNAGSTSTNGSNGGSGGNAGCYNDSLHVGPNPLSQSMSATVIRQHSSDATLSRTRSQSVLGGGKHKSSAHKVQRQLSNGGGSSIGAGISGGSNSLQIPNWNDPLAASSPCNGGMRQRTSTIKQQPALSTDPNELFCRSKSTNLITCDSSALNSGERLDMHTFPKALEKFQQIQESAGEAMVSGTNSEDESCSASSDDLASSSSASKRSTGSMTTQQHQLQQQQQLKPTKNSSHMSIDEVVLLERGNSPSARTPMDVSWSEDVKAFNNDSAA